MDLDTLCRANRLSDKIRDLETKLKCAQRLRERSGTVTISRCNSDLYISDSRVINDVLDLIEKFCTNRINELKVEFEKL